MLRAGLKFLIKDALRGARYTVRQSARSKPPIDFPGRTQLTRMADTMLTSIEETMVTLRYGSDQADDMIRAALGDYTALVGTIGAHDFESRFASIHYRLSKAILLHRGLDTTYSSELAYAGAARRIVNRSKGHKAWSAPVFAADVSVVLIEAAPIRGVPASDETGATGDVFWTDTNTACAFALGLTVAAWLTKGDGVSAVECVDSASAIVGAAFGRMEATSRAADPVTALAAVFEELAAFVP